MSSSSTAERAIWGRFSVPVPPLDRPNFCIDLPPAPAGRLRVRLRKAAGPRFPEVRALAVTGTASDPQGAGASF